MGLVVLAVYVYRVVDFVLLLKGKERIYMRYSVFEKVCVLAFVVLIAAAIASTAGVTLHGAVAALAGKI